MISADTGAIIHGGKTVFRDDPAEALPGFPVTDAILLPRKISFNQSTLGTTTKTYVSATKASIMSLATFYAALGAEFTIEEGEKYTLTVTLPYDEFSSVDSDPTVFTMWELTPNEIQRSMYDVGIYSPSSQGGQISSTRQTVSLPIKSAIEYSSKNIVTTVNLMTDPNYKSQAYLAENFLALSRLHTDSVLAFGQTLKRNIILHNVSSVPPNPIDEYGVSTVVSTTDLISLYNIPLNISSIMLPSYARRRTLNVGNTKDNVDIVGLAGWLVKPPTYSYISPIKIQLTQEYIWNEWIDSLYKPYNGNYVPFAITSL